MMSIIPYNIIKALKNTISISRVHDLIPHLASSIVVLRYHSIKDNPSNYNKLLSQGIIHSKNDFHDQMELVARNYNAVSIDDMVDIFLRKKTLPKKAVVVTFDDGYADNIEIAAPILNHFGIPACFYITTNSIGNQHAIWYVRIRYAILTSSMNSWDNPIDNCHYNFINYDDRLSAFIDSCHYCARLTGEQQKNYVDNIVTSLDVDDSTAYNNLMMTWDDVSSLIKMGHIVGSHTIFHPNIAHIDTDDAEHEIVESKRIIERNTPVKVKHFSYPNPALEPNWTNDLSRIINKAGYLTSVTCDHGCVRLHDDLFSIPRIAVPHDKNEFLFRLNMAYINH